MKKTNEAKKPFRSPKRKLRDKAFAKFFGKKLKEARRKSGLSPKDFAEQKLGVSESSYYQMTSGGSSLSDGRVHEVCEKMGEEYEVYIGGEKFIYVN